MPIIAQTNKNTDVEQSGIDTLARPSIPQYFVAEKTSSSTSVSSSSSSVLISTSESSTIKSSEATKLPNSAVDPNVYSYVLYILSAVFILGLGLLSFQNGIRKNITDKEN
jgi:hypothetical protein